MAREPDDIACWQRIGPHLTTSGRLTGGNIDSLADIGVTHVINLTLADSPGALFDEAEHLAARGIGYTHIPVPFDAPDAAHFARFCAAMEANEAASVHVHCVMNWRVSAFLYRWHRERQHMPADEARALMERQWTPQTNGNKDAPAWVRFIAGEAS